jgi:biotin transport system substrate-specific component
MRALLPNQDSLHSIFWSNPDKLGRQLLIIIAGVLFLTLSAHLTIPFLPIPLTLQTSAVVLLGLTMGAKQGSQIVCAYLVAGFAGLPVFATPHFFGLTFGFLLGFLPAVVLCGYLAQNGWANNFFKSFFAAAMGVCVIFVYGFIGLALFVNPHYAYLVGVKPFLITEPLKLIVVALIAPCCWKY